MRCSYLAGWLLPLVIIYTAVELHAEVDLNSHQCIFNCRDKWRTNQLCHKLNSSESVCKSFSDIGEPCCYAGKTTNEHWKYLCLNTSYDGSYAKEFHECFSKAHAKQPMCQQPNYKPTAISNGASCKALSGKELIVHIVWSEFQCMDLCLRNLRCIAFNINEPSDDRLFRHCQLLESVPVIWRGKCKEGYTGKFLDRVAFHKAYLDPGCRSAT